ncbi:MAG: hypothetical protein M3Y34_04495 [Actinomycetota bacterium]|nr:hypothetical protein [Actinomycetota bacterium]
MKRLVTVTALALLAIPLSEAGAATVTEIGELSGPPGQMTYADGNAWVLFDGSGGENLARVKPSGKVTEYDVDDLDGAVDIALGPAGNSLWASVSGGVVEMPVANPENSTLHDVDALDGGAQGITAGPDNRMYAAGGDQFVSFPANNPADQDQDTIGGMSARGVAAAGGRIWVVDFAGTDIVRVKPNGEKFKRFNVGGGPQQVAGGPSGLIAYTNPGTDPQTVGRIDGNDVKKTKTDGDPFGIEFAGGRWWIGQFNRPGKMGVLSPGGNLSQFKNGLPDNGKTRYLAAGGGTVFAGIENRDEVAIIEDL